MTFAEIIARMKRADKNAEVIFDRDEPVGAATDLVMPRRRWFSRQSANERTSGFTSRPPSSLAESLNR